MERNIENELMEIKRDVTALRDKAVSAKAMLANVENQIGEHLGNLSALIKEDARPAFDAIAEKLRSNLSSVETAEELKAWVENYAESLTEENLARISSLKEAVAQWKEITG